MDSRYTFGVDFRPYNHELIREMYYKRICGIPVSFFLLDLRKTNTYCHINADLLSFIIPESNRVTGNIPAISGDDNSHSWVEINDILFDTTQGLMWHKPIYYEKYQPTDIRIVSREETIQNLSEYLKYDKNLKEMYVAWCSDLERGLSRQPYCEYLRAHIDEFRKEKNLNVKDYDEQLVQEFLDSLQQLYQATETFLQESRGKETEETEHS